MSSAKKILIIYFHPRFEASRAIKSLVTKASTLPFVHLRDMYEIYPDFNIDVEKEKEILSHYDILLWMHPFYWYSCPPLMKQWIDLVLEYGWAYGKDGDKLSGKIITNVLSSGGTFEVYQKDGRNRFTYRELLSPFEQTSFLCKMIYAPPFILPGANRATQLQFEEYTNLFINVLNLLNNEKKDMNKILSLQYFNDITQEQWENQYYLMQ